MTTRAKNTFAARLKSLRAESGLSQPALALTAAVSVGVIRDYEQGRRQPQLTILLKLCGALKCSLAEFDNVAVS